MAQANARGLRPDPGGDPRRFCALRSTPNQTGIGPWLPLTRCTNDEREALGIPARTPDPGPLRRLPTALTDRPRRPISEAGRSAADGRLRKAARRRPRRSWNLAGDAYRRRLPGWGAQENRMAELRMTHFSINGLRTPTKWQIADWSTPSKSTRRRGSRPQTARNVCRSPRVRQPARRVADGCTGRATKSRRNAGQKPPPPWMRSADGHRQRAGRCVAPTADQPPRRQPDRARYDPCTRPWQHQPRRAGQRAI